MAQTNYLSNGEHEVYQFKVEPVWNSQQHSGVAKGQVLIQLAGYMWQFYGIEEAREKFRALRHDGYTRATKDDFDAAQQHHTEMRMRGESGGAYNGSRNV